MIDVSSTFFSCKHKYMMMRNLELSAASFVQKKIGVSVTSQKSLWSSFQKQKKTRNI